MYKERAQKLLNEKIDLNKLSEVAKKTLDTLTADDLATIGFKSQYDEKFLFQLPTAKISVKIRY